MSYESLLAKRETEEAHAEVFESEFPAVTGRAVKIINTGESPDAVALIDGIETGIELTSIHAGDADGIVGELYRLATQKHESYLRRGLFARPMILLGHLSWPAPEVEGTTLWDERKAILDLVFEYEFAGLGFSEIWLMDDGIKYTSRRDPGCPADFFCFAPADAAGFYEHERKRRPYWSFIVEQHS